MGKIIKELVYQYKDLQVKILYKKIRHTYLRVKPEGYIEVTTNYRSSLKYLDQLIDRFYTSLKSKQQSVQAYRENLQTLSEGLSIKLCGKEYLLVVSQAKQNKVNFCDGNCFLAVKDPDNLELKQQTLHKGYKQIAKQVFAELISSRFSYFEKLGFSMPKLTIKTMRTRWGSYAKATNRINLNLALIYLEPKLIDYVVVHELCHIIEQNHSRKFYDLMAIFLPNWYDLRRELKAHAYIL